MGHFLQSIPFSYDVGCAKYIHDEETKLDFGVLPLHDLHRAGLAKNNILPISRENWIHQESLTFSCYKMLGFPVHLQSKKQIQPVMIGIDRLSPQEVDNIPTDAKPTDTRFVGQIPPEVTIRTIEGMSGGPIYGFRRAENGRWYYHIVALQSTWLEKSRIVFGCSLPVVAEAVGRALSDSPAE